jgi:hypothetical protein
MDAEAAGRAERIWGMLRGYFVAQGVYVAARLGMADLLARAGGPVAVADLAQATGSHPDALYRVLRALAGEGMFAELPGKAFALTPLGEMLRADVEGSMRPAALVAGETQYKVWALFKDAVKHGTPGFDRIFRQPLFPFLDEHPEVHALFNAAMGRRVERQVDRVVAACDVRPGETIVDVGGGVGRLLAAMLGRFPEARGVLYDGERVIAAARDARLVEACGGGVDLVAGDFLKAVPAGNVMLLATVLHMFQDEEAGRILRNCRTSLPAGGRVYVIERLLAAANEPDSAKWDDLNMLLMTGGRERTLAEYAALLEAAGFGCVEAVAEDVVRAVAV